MRRNWRICGKNGAQHVALVLKMHRAKFGLNRADSIRAMIKGGINGTYAAKLAHLTFVAMRSITLPNLVPIGQKLSKLRPF